MVSLSAAHADKRTDFMEQQMFPVFSEHNKRPGVSESSGVDLPSRATPLNGEWTLQR